MENPAKTEIPHSNHAYTPLQSYPRVWPNILTGSVANEQIGDQAKLSDSVDIGGVHHIWVELWMALICLQ